VALRVQAPIYAEDTLLDSNAVEVTDDEVAPKVDPENVQTIEVSESMGPEELKEHLRRLNPEDFGRFTP
jgi:bifunctional DNase/RNase